MEEKRETVHSHRNTACPFPGHTSSPFADSNAATYPEVDYADNDIDTSKTDITLRLSKLAR